MKISHLILCVIGLIALVGLLVPSISTPSEAARRSSRFNKLRQLMSAMRAHVEDNGKFPPVTYNGENLLSWRVSLLPYLGEQELFDKIDKSVGWNHPNNKGYHDQMPAVFLDPSINYSSLTPYIAVSGPGSGWPPSNNPIGYDDISDGVSNTVALVAIPKNQVNWLSPATINIDDFAKLTQQTKHPRLCYALFDGSVTSKPLPKTLDQLKSFFLIADAE